MIFHSGGIRVGFVVRFENLSYSPSPFSREHEGNEELRMRIDLLAAATDFSAIKNPQVLALSTASREMWDAHKTYVLGREVRLKEVKDDSDRVVHTPSWNLVLNFEFALRYRAAELMNEGWDRNGNKPMDMAEAMAAARRCEDTRREHFLDKLHLQYIGRSSPGPSSSHNNDNTPRVPPKRPGNPNKEIKDPKIPKKEPKGKGKGKDNKLPNGKTLAVTHEGKQICFQYGSKKCKKGAKCTRLHVCQICFGEHPWKECLLAA
jgi:hypothetical protein